MIATVIVDVDRGAVCQTAALMVLIGSPSD